MHFRYAVEDDAPNRNKKQVEIVGVKGWNVVRDIALWLMAQWVFCICAQHYINGMVTQARIYPLVHDKLTNTDESLMAETEGNKKNAPTLTDRDV